MAITAQMVKELREKTGAGMMDCKKALEATNGNIEDAIDYLRKQGVSQAAKKADRIAAEGSAHIEIDGNTAVLLEVNCETDFVTKNEQFQTLLKDLGKHLVKEKPASVEEALEQKFLDQDETVGDVINTAIATIGEKISLRRFEIFTKTENDAFGAYLHMEGRIGALVLLEGTQDDVVARDVAMHVAALNPKYVSRNDVPEEEVNREKDVLMSQAAQEGKPEHIVERIVEGRLGKFYEEICLLEQKFVKDPDVTVEKFVSNNNATIKEALRYEVGEGMEKREDDFAEEVMSQIKNK